MPMKNSSTFIYFVKNFFGQSDSDLNTMNSSSEKILTAMEKPGFMPSDQSIRTILDFAYSYDVVETDTTGQIEMNYN